MCTAVGFEAPMLDSYWCDCTQTHLLAVVLCAGQVSYLCPTTCLAESRLGLVQHAPLNTQHCFSTAVYAIATTLRAVTLNFFTTAHKNWGLPT